MDENNQPALSLQDVEISYRTVKPLRFFELLRRGSSQQYFHAVKGVSFALRQGEIVGIVGNNGSGKSTLLRAIAGIYAPDKGSINTFGRTAALMAIGVGFQNALSGRDNIYLSGMLMGFSKKQIQEKERDIIAFSELEAFIDQPVESYSSGMHSKLAFSITAILESKIILIDETLSVGDRRFRQKSLDKMKELITREDTTVLIVSHSDGTLAELCSRVLWMHDGIIKMDGPTQEVLAAYNRFMDDSGKKRSPARPAAQKREAR